MSDPVCFCTNLLDDDEVIGCPKCKSRNITVIQAFDGIDISSDLVYHEKTKRYAWRRVDENYGNMEELTFNCKNCQLDWYEGEYEED